MMEPFQLVRQFFTRQTCRFCSANFAMDDIHLLGRGRNYYMVGIHCHACGKHNGDATVGFETADPRSGMPQQARRHMKAAMQQFLQRFSGGNELPFGAPAEGEPIEMSLDELLEFLGHQRRFDDPELTMADIERLQELPPIAEDDVLSAHEFFNDLDSDWSKHIPAELRPDDEELALASRAE